MIPVATTAIAAPVVATTAIAAPVVATPAIVHSAASECSCRNQEGSCRNRRNEREFAYH
jgi:hypothetical protein